MVAHYWKANDENDAVKKHSKPSNTNKNKFIYEKLHKKETLQNITNSNIGCKISLSVCACVYVTNTNIMVKD